jgi:hypothetical protein
MSFERFLKKIVSLLPGRILGEQQAMELARLNPDKIYVENVRSVLVYFESSPIEASSTA